MAEANTSMAVLARSGPTTRMLTTSQTRGWSNCKGPVPRVNSNALPPSPYSTWTCVCVRKRRMMDYDYFDCRGAIRNRSTYSAANPLIITALLYVPTSNSNSTGTRDRNR